MLMTLFFSSVLSFLTHLKWDQISKVSKALRALIFCEPNCLKKIFFLIILVSDLFLDIQEVKRRNKNNNNNDMQTLQPACFK